MMITLAATEATAMPVYGPDNPARTTTEQLAAIDGGTVVNDRYELVPAMTAAELAEARDWIADCMWADDIDAATLTDIQVERGIARHYDGGINGFRQDAGL